MNIALIASGALRSKKEATWLTLFLLAKEYQNQGHTAVICAEKHPSLPAVEEVEGIKVYRLYKGKFLTARKTLRNIAQEQNITFNVIHGFSSIPALGLSTVLAGRLFPKAKTVHTIKSSSKYTVGRIISARILNRVDTVTVSTDKLKQDLVKQGCSAGKIAVVRSPIDLDKFKPRNKEELKEKYGFGDKTLIFYYGALRKEKGVDYLLRAIPFLVKDFPNIKVFLAIRSQVQEKCEKYLQLVQELNVGQYVAISLDDLPIEEYVAMADIVVLAYPTLIGTEGNPSCLLESMASKTPVVTTDLAELREIVTADEDVLMTKAGSVESLAEQIKRLLRDPTLGKKLAENAFKKAKEFDVRVISNEFLAIYREIKSEKNWS